MNLIDNPPYIGKIVDAECLECGFKGPYIVDMDSKPIFIRWCPGCTTTAQHVVVEE